MSRGETKRAGWGEARLAFAVLAAEIFAILNHPVALSAVHARFKDRLNMSYSQFCYWVKEYRRREMKTGNGRINQDSSLASDTNSSPREASANKRGPLYIKPDPPRTFHYDPMDAYRKKWD